MIEYHKAQIKMLSKKATLFRKEATSKRASRDFLGAVITKNKENEIRLLISRHKQDLAKFEDQA